MKIRKMLLAIPAFLFLSAAVLAQEQSPAPSPAPPQKSAPSPTPASVGDAKTRAEIYYDLALGHYYVKMYEQMYDYTCSSEHAKQAIAFFKQAYAHDHA